MFAKKWKKKKHKKIVNNERRVARNGIVWHELVVRVHTVQRVPSTKRKILCDVTTLYGRYALSGNVPRLANARYVYIVWFQVILELDGFHKSGGKYCDSGGEIKLRRTRPFVQLPLCFGASPYISRPYVLHIYYTYYFNHDWRRQRCRISLQ